MIWHEHLFLGHDGLFHKHNINDSSLDSASAFHENPALAQERVAGPFTTTLLAMDPQLDMQQEIRKIMQLSNKNFQHVLGAQERRPGSAPPQVDELPGSPLAGDYAASLFSMAQPTTLSTMDEPAQQPGIFGLNDNKLREQLADPEYVKFYYANKNINPRLPPPIVGREQRFQWGDNKGISSEGLADQAVPEADALNMLFGSQLGLKETSAPIPIQDHSQYLSQATDAFGTSPWNVRSVGGNDQLDTLLQAYSSPKNGGVGLSPLVTGEVKAPGSPSLFALHSTDEATMFQDPIFGNGSAPHTPRSSQASQLTSAAQLFEAAIGSPQRTSAVGSALGLGVKDPKIQLGGFSPASSPQRAIGDRPKATPSKLRNGSMVEKSLDGPSAHDQFPLHSQGPAFSEQLAALAAALPGGLPAGGPDQAAAAVAMAAAAAGQGGPGSDGIPGLFPPGMPSGLSPSPQQMQMYMAAAAMYPYYAQHQGLQNFQAAMQAMQVGYPGFMGMPPMMGYPGFPMMPPPNGFGGQLPGMPDVGGMRPPFPMLPPNMYPPMPGMPPFPMSGAVPTEYAAYYQKMMEMHAASAAAAAMNNGRSSPGGVDGIDRDREDKGSHANNNRDNKTRYGDDGNNRTDGGNRRGNNGNSAPGDARPGDRNARVPSRDNIAANKRDNNGRVESGGGSKDNARRGNRREEITTTGDRRIDLVLEEFKNNKNKKFEIKDILGHVYEFSLDQHGSRFIQQKLETVSQEDLGIAFMEVLPRCLTLMTDVFGNYVIQKFLEHGSPEHRLKLAGQLKDNVMSLSLQMYGCRVVQKALEVLPTEAQCDLIKELDGHVMRCVRDQNGNHVIQKIIECVPTDRIQPLLENFMTCVTLLSTHPFGCRVIQRILEHCRDEKKRTTVMEEILQNTCQLAQDQYGNYVIQHVLEHGNSQERLRVVKALAPEIVKLSLHKFASNVVEKCLIYCSVHERDMLIKGILEEGKPGEEDPLQTLMKDQFGNYVVQKVLEVCDDMQREKLLQRVRAQLHALKKYTFGKHIVARVEKLLCTGAKMQNNAKLQGRPLPDDAELQALQQLEQQRHQEAQAAATASPGTASPDTSCGGSLVADADPGAEEQPAAAQSLAPASGAELTAVPTVSPQAGVVA
mmetsp:Transcript_21372/g.46751  ORF Transcript_21372/g.46751 Transcript_21372/m.46751 type:complete len:1134 (+) Transcript_21372:1-3402(+)